MPYKCLIIIIIIIIIIIVIITITVAVAVIVIIFIIIAKGSFLKLQGNNIFLECKAMKVSFCD